MGACMSAEDQADKARSAAIDTQLMEESRRLKKEAKVGAARYRPRILTLILAHSRSCF
jgi:hypothetical protein